MHIFLLLNHFFYHLFYERYSFHFVSFQGKPIDCLPPLIDVVSNSVNHSKCVCLCFHLRLIINYNNKSLLPSVVLPWTKDADNHTLTWYWNISDFCNLSKNLLIRTLNLIKERGNDFFHIVQVFRQAVVTHSNTT